MIDRSRDVAEIFPRKALTIGIPTWNRSDKLDRLLRALVELRRRNGLRERIDIVVSDNASTDRTEEVCKQYRDEVIYQRHTHNVGFDRNCVSIARNATSEYLLLFADDDIPLDELFIELLNAIESHQPSAIIFSFIQAPYSRENPSVCVAGGSKLVTHETEALVNIIKYPKVTAYCIKNDVIGSKELEDIKESRSGTGYLFLTLALRVFMTSGRPLMLLKRPLARSDEDAFVGFRFSPVVWARMKRAVYFEDLQEDSKRVLDGLRDDEMWAMLWGAIQRELGRLTFEQSINRDINKYLVRNAFQALHFRYWKYVSSLAVLMVLGRMPGGRRCINSLYRVVVGENLKGSTE
ncbi:MAG: glycosyltransferase family 2 protein [Candidatus Geothermincolia bacterium]